MTTLSPATMFSLILTRLSSVINGETFTPKVSAASLAADSKASAVVVRKAISLLRAFNSDESKLPSLSNTAF